MENHIPKFKLPKDLPDYSSE